MGTTERAVLDMEKLKERAPAIDHARIERVIEHIRAQQRLLDQTKQELTLAVNMPAWVLDNGM